MDAKVKTVVVLAGLVALWPAPTLAADFRPIVIPWQTYVGWNPGPAASVFPGASCAASRDAAITRQYRKPKAKPHKSAPPIVRVIPKQLASWEVAVVQAERTALRDEMHVKAEAARRELGREQYTSTNINPQ